MSKISLESPFRHSGARFATCQIIFKEMYGTKFTSQICHPRTKPYTEEELHEAKLAMPRPPFAAILSMRTAGERRSAFKSQRKYKRIGLSPAQSMQTSVSTTCPIVAQITIIK